ncbi:MAG TPA: hypothetical protein VLX92_15595 [Kofleriaceae bacterium]|nr:hypothetical protein [Kofleriaceae bacterium]
MVRVLAVALVVACGGPSAPPTPAGPPAQLIATREGGDDVIVAQVNGKPVWGSCVAAQAARHHLARDAALHECVDFELLAQAAAQRGLATDPLVVDATRTALVGQLVAKAYEDGMTRPSDFGSAWDKFVDKNRWLVKHVEYRASTYVRVEVPDKAPPEVDAAAKAVAERIAAAVAGQTGMLPVHFLAYAEQAAAGAKYGHEDVRPFRQDALVPAYGDALFAIPEIGRASPAVRTPWGWDVILYTGDVPATDPTPEQIAAQLLPGLKQSYFSTWVDQLQRELGIKVEIAKDAQKQLESLP